MIGTLDNMFRRRYKQMDGSPLVSSAEDLHEDTHRICEPFPHELEKIHAVCINETRKPQIIQLLQLS